MLLGRLLPKSRLRPLVYSKEFQNTKRKTNRFCELALTLPVPLGGGLRPVSGCDECSLPQTQWQRDAQLSSNNRLILGLSGPTYMPISSESDESVRWDLRAYQSSPVVTLKSYLRSHLKVFHLLINLSFNDIYTCSDLVRYLKVATISA